MNEWLYTPSSSLNTSLILCIDAIVGVLAFFSYLSCYCRNGSVVVGKHSCFLLIFPHIKEDIIALLINKIGTHIIDTSIKQIKCLLHYNRMILYSTFCSQAWLRPIWMRFRRSLKIFVLLIKESINRFEYYQARIEAIDKIFFEMLVHQFHLWCNLF